MSEKHQLIEEFVDELFFYILENKENIKEWSRCRKEIQEREILLTKLVHKKRRRIGNFSQ